MDLSHVGAKTTEEAIRHSAMPVAFTHCCPIAFLDHPRNKTDAEMRLIAERGGFVGVATYTPFLPWQDETTVEQCVEVFEHVIDVAGEDHVGLGTDFTEGQDVAFFEWLRRDKGIGRNLMAGGDPGAAGAEGPRDPRRLPQPDGRDAAPGLEPAAGREDHGRQLAAPLPGGLGGKLSRPPPRHGEAPAAARASAGPREGNAPGSGPDGRPAPRDEHRRRGRGDRPRRVE